MHRRDFLTCAAGSLAVLSVSRHAFPQRKGKLVELAAEPKVALLRDAKMREAEAVERIEELVAKL